MLQARYAYSHCLCAISPDDADRRSAHLLKTGALLIEAEAA
jgi:hypothetical protein